MAIPPPSSPQPLLIIKGDIKDLHATHAAEMSALITDQAAKLKDAFDAGHTKAMDAVKLANQFFRPVQAPATLQRSSPGLEMPAFGSFTNQMAGGAFGATGPM